MEIPDDNIANGSYDQGLAEYHDDAGMAVEREALHTNDFDDDDNEAYPMVLSRLTLSKLSQKGQRRDPRALRLAAVTSAVVEMARKEEPNAEQAETMTNPEKAVSASRVYAKAMTALEGTLSVTLTTVDQHENDNDTIRKVIDSWATQVALLELLTETLPHVQPVGILQATLPLFSRVLRAVVATTQDVGSSTSCTSKTNTSDGKLLLETRDELGGSNAVLRGSCRAVACFVQRLTESTSVDTKAIQQLYLSTLIRLWEDGRPKVRKGAQSSALQILQETRNTPVHSVVLKATSHYFHSILIKARKELEATMNGKTPVPNERSKESSSALLHGLSMLERCMVSLDFDTLSTDVMELLALVFQVDATMAAAASKSSDFVTTKMSKIQSLSDHCFLLHGLLSVIIKALEHDEEEEDRLDGDTTSKTKAETIKVKINTWSGRVLASLLSAQPAVLFRSGSAPDQVLERGRSLYGQAVLAALRRVVENKDQSNGLSYRLLPLTIQMVLLLSKPVVLSHHGHDNPDESASFVANGLLSDLTQIFRSRSFHNLIMMAEQKQDIHDLLVRCLTESLRGMHVLFRPEYHPCWSVGLKALVVLLEQIINTRPGGERPLSVKVISTNVENLIDQHHVTPNHALQRHVEDALSTLVQGTGIEGLWSFISWHPGQSPATDTTNNDSKLGIHVGRAWVLTTMKNAALTAQPRSQHLGFFQKHILVMARQMDRLAAEAAQAETTVSTKKSILHHRARVVDLWSLLPCFCKAPTDVATALPALSVVLSKALEDSRYPQLVSIIARAIAVLCTESKVPSSKMGGGSEDGAVEGMAKASQKILPVLFKLIVTSSISKSGSGKDENSMNIDTPSKKTVNQDTSPADIGQQTQAITEAIAGLSRYAPPQFLQGLFKKLMHKLLDEIQSESRDEDKICSYLCLSQALVTSETLDESNLSFLYRTLKPFIRSQDDAGIRCQKRAYKTLVEMCERNQSGVFLNAERIKEITLLLTETVHSSSQVAARCMRMKCLKHVVDGIDDSLLPEIINNHKVLAETLLSLKDNNAKTREAAYQLLLAMATRQRGRLEQFLSVVTAALGAETAHLRSAAVMGLSRIVYEFAWNGKDEDESESLQSTLPVLLSTVLVLINENSREVIKSVIGFVRICVAAMNREKLEPMIPELVPGLLSFHKTKNRFRSKIKIILKRLVKYFGYEKLMPYVPESEQRLLVHIRKLDERQKRKKNALKQGNDGEHTVNHGTFDAMLESDEEDSDDGRTLMTGATGFTQLTGRGSIKTSKTHVSIAASARTKDTMVSSSKQKSKHGSSLQLHETDGEVVDMLGAKMARHVKFAVDIDDIGDDDDSDGIMEFDDEGRLIVHDEDNARREIEEEHPWKKQRTTKSGSAQKTTQRRNGKSSSKHLGAAYKSKKAGGDVKRKNQAYEPYAFVPLDGKSYSKKNRRTAVESMSSVVRLGKKRKS